MSLRLILPAAAGCAALALSACAPPHPHPHPKPALKSVTALDCPRDPGNDLTRKAVAADGKSCDYSGPDGSSITLMLVSVDGGDAKAALAPLEAKLRTELPAAGGTPAVKTGDKEKVDIDLPGIHIHTNGSDSANAKGAATVQIGSGVKVSSSKPGSGGVTVNAGDNGAEVHISEPGGGLRQMFVLASDAPGPNGARMAGYEARGPESGPLVVATIVSKTNDRDEMRDDMRDLLRLNVGG